VKQTFIIASRVEEVSGICQLLVSDMDSLAISKSIIAEVELCLTETLTNVIRHAYMGDTEQTIEVSYLCTNDGITISILDTGIFVPIAPVRSLEFNLDDRLSLPEGGMGLFIVYQVMDEVTHYNKNNNNVLTLKKNFH